MQPLHRTSYDPTRKLIFLLGTGGVGKTTCSVLLAQALAAQGRRIKLLTVDPARRLESLMERLASATGQLDIEQMDVSERFAHFVERHSPDAETADQVLNSRFYPHLSGRLQALHEYVAGDRILELVEADDYDHIVVDTPPFSYALHFFEAPRRLHQMASMAHSIFSAGQSGSQAIKLLSPLLVRGLSYFVGKGFLAELVDFVASLSRLWGEVARSAKATQELYQSDSEFGIVVRPDSRSGDDLAEFLDHAPEWLAPAFVIANQVLQTPPDFTAPGEDALAHMERMLMAQEACRAWRPTLLASAAALALRLGHLAHAVKGRQSSALGHLMTHSKTAQSRLLTVPLVRGGLATEADLVRLSQHLMAT